MRDLQKDGAMTEMYCGKMAPPGTGASRWGARALEPAAVEDVEIANDDGEPIVELASGRRVLRCVRDMVRDLEAVRYTIAANPNGDEVSVSPRIHDDAWCVLDLNWHDVVEILK